MDFNKLMKGIFMVTICMGISICAHAQTFSEWFRQKSTQKKYLLEQIAALKVYSSYVQKGYSIAKNGLGSINDLKNGELKLHHVFYDGLSIVNPRIRNYHRVAGIVHYQAQIIQHWNAIRSSLSEDGHITADRKAYFNRVYDRMNDDCLEVLDELLTATTNGGVKMGDEERIRWIDRLYDRMSANYRFCRGYGDEIRQWSGQQGIEQRDIINSRLLNGIKP